MKIQIHNGLREPQTLEVTRVLILDSLDNPLAVAVETDPGIIILETADNPGQFNTVLMNLGISRTVMVHEGKQRNLPEIIIPNA